MKKIYCLSVMLLLPFLSMTQDILNPKFEKKIEQLLDHSIATISCERLKLKINNPNLYILDAREKKEYNTSHLKNAIWVGYEKFKAAALDTIPKDAILVVYCSIGYRSEKIGEKIKKLGYSRVYNLYGGIFEWCNRAYPLVDNQNKETCKIHTYSFEWAKWIKKGEKVF